MGASIARTCRHCGTNAIPSEHRCGGKQNAIDVAFQERLSRRDTRPQQVWDAERRIWIKYSRYNTTKVQ